MTFDPSDLYEQLFLSFTGAGRAYQTLLDAGLPHDEVMQEVVGRLRALRDTPEGRQATERYQELFGQVAPHLFSEPAPRPPLIYDTIQRLFRENPSPLPDQAPAIECAVLFHGGASIQGSLSETPDGGLRMLSPNPDPGARPARGKVAMVEQFFGYEDVVMVGVRREVEVVAPKITS